MDIRPKSAPKIEAFLEPGFVFDPTDEELVVDYLLNWIRFEHRLPCDIVILDDIYRTEPWNLLEEYHRKKDGYFLTQIKPSNNNASTRKSRKAGEGSYTVQIRKDYEVVSDGIEIKWQKSAFSYYQRKEEEEEGGERRKLTRKTSGWVMHEYEITSKESKWVLCRVKLSDQEIARKKRREESGDAVAVADRRQWYSFGGFSMVMEFEPNKFFAENEMHEVEKESVVATDGGVQTTNLESFADLDTTDKLRDMDIEELFKDYY